MNTDNEKTADLDSQTTLSAFICGSIPPHLLAVPSPYSTETCYGVLRFVGLPAYGMA